MKQLKAIFICTLLASPSLSFADIPKISPSWTGMYNNGEQKISLFFQQKGQDVTGYSLLNGKQIKFQGKIQPKEGQYQLILNELGQGKEIGKFTLNYQNNHKAIEAQWVSNDKYIRPKFFTLDARQCTYAKTSGEFPESSSELLKDADLQVPLGHLQLLRNEIYARHGYAFQSKHWASHFSGYHWYMPCYIDVESRLTKIEKENIKRIKLVEPYAKDVEWGR